MANKQKPTPTPTQPTTALLINFTIYCDTRPPPAFIFSSLFALLIHKSWVFFSYLLPVIRKYITWTHKHIYIPKKTCSFITSYIYAHTERGLGACAPSCHRWDPKNGREKKAIEIKWYHCSLFFFLLRKTLVSSFRCCYIHVHVTTLV